MYWNDKRDTLELLNYPMEYRKEIMNKSIKIKDYSLVDRLAMIGYGIPTLSGLSVFGYGMFGENGFTLGVSLMTTGFIVMMLSLPIGRIALNYGRKLEKEAEKKGIIYKFERYKREI